MNNIMTAKEMNELTKEWKENLVKKAVENTIAEFKSAAMKGYYAKKVEIPTDICIATWSDALISLGYSRGTTGSTTMVWSW